MKIFNKKTKKIAILLFVMVICFCFPLLCGCSNESFSKMIANAEKGDVVLLEKDMTCDDEIFVNQDLTLDLGARMLTLQKPIVIKSGATLTVKNGNVNGSGDFDCLFKTEGKLVVNGAIIKASGNTNGITNLGETQVDGGTIAGYYGIANSGNLVVDDGTIYTTQQEPNGYAIKNTGTAIIKNGIVGESKINPNYGTIYFTPGIENYGKVVIENGQIGSVYSQGNNAKAYFYGGKIMESVHIIGGYAETEDKKGNLVFAGSSPFDVLEGTAVIKGGVFTDLYDEHHASTGAIVSFHGTVSVYGGSFCETEMSGVVNVYGGTFNNSVEIIPTSTVKFMGGTFKKGAKIAEHTNQIIQQLIFNLHDVLEAGYKFSIAIDKTAKETTQEFSVVIE